MPSRALTVAIVASVLLVVVVAADATMNRVYHAEVFLDGRWIKVATYPWQFDPYSRGIPSYVAFEVNASDDVPVRVRIDNGYPWAFSERFEVLSGGRVLFEGTLTAAARSEGVAETTVKAEQLFRHGYEPLPAKDTPPVDQIWNPHLEVRVGDEIFGGSFALREVPR
jgi:hypothetical protein